MALLPATQQTTKPGPGARPIPGHPFTPTLAFLFNERSGAQAYAIQSPTFGTLSSGATFRSVAGFPALGMQIPHNSHGLLDVSYPNDAPFLGAITLVWKGYIESIAAGGSGYQHFAGKHTGDGSVNNPFDFRTSLFTTAIEVVRANASNENTWTSAAIPDVRDQYCMAAVACPESIGGTPTFAFNGRILGASVAGTEVGLATGSNANIRIGQRADGALVQLDGGSVELMFFYGHQLSAENLRALYRDPYAWLDNPLRRWVPGATVVTGTLTVSGIGSAEAVPTGHHLGDITIESGLASAEAIGSPTLFAGDIALLAGIASEEAVSTIGLFGEAGAAGTITLSAGIATAEAFGSATLTDGATISPTGIPSAEDMDLHTVGAPVATILAYGITSMEGFGTPSVFTLTNPAEPAPGICGALSKPLRLRRAEDFVGAPEPAAILPDVYGDFTDGGLHGPIPAVLLTAAAPWLYCAASHPVKSIDKVYIDDVEQTSGFSTSPAYPAPALTDIGQGYQTQIGTISFDAQPAGVVTWRGLGMAEDDGTLIENPIRQLEVMLRLRGLYTDSHFEAGALAQAKSDAAGYTLAWVVRDDRQIQDWVTEVLFNVMGYWRVNGRGELAMGLDAGGAFARSDLAASYLAARDCLNGDDGVEITFDRRNLVNRLSVYFMYDWSTDMPADIGVVVEDAASVNAHGEARKSVVLKGHRTSAQVTTWGTALLNRQSFATRVEGAIVRFILTDARAMHLCVGDLIAFTWPYGPVRESSNPYTNQILRVVAITQDTTRGGATTVEAIDTGEYVTDDAGDRLLTVLP